MLIQKKNKPIGAGFGSNNMNSGFPNFPFDNLFFANNSEEGQNVNGQQSPEKSKQSRITVLLINLVVI